MVAIPSAALLAALWVVFSRLFKTTFRTSRSADQRRDDVHVPRRRRCQLHPALDRLAVPCFGERPSRSLLILEATTTAVITPALNLTVVVVSSLRLKSALTCNGCS
jgi:hypothetical protein